MLNINDPIHAYLPLWGAWQADDLIGEGSYGRVYRISREDIGGRYESAVKHIRIPKSDLEVSNAKNVGMDDKSMSLYFGDMAGKIINEIKAMYSLRGIPHIVAYEDHAIFHEGNSLQWDVFIRMELLTPLTAYLEGYSLASGDVRRLGVEICAALAACEKKGILHRDIKDGNIFVSEDGAFKLGDFGIARNLAEQTQSITLRGTPTYLAPEVFNGKAYDSRVDIYSLGILLYKLLNGNRYPFLPAPPEPIGYGDVEKAFARRMRGEPVPEPTEGGKTLRAIVQKACSYSPGDRYQTAEEMQQALQKAGDKKSAMPAAVPLRIGRQTQAAGTAPQAQPSAGYGATGVPYGTQPGAPYGASYSAAAAPQAAPQQATPQAAPQQPYAGAYGMQVVPQQAVPQQAAPQQAAPQRVAPQPRAHRPPSPQSERLLQYARYGAMAAAGILLCVMAGTLLAKPVSAPASVAAPYGEEQPVAQLGEYGYMVGELAVSPSYVSAVSAELRQHPFTGEPIVEWLSKHRGLSITGECGEWYRVELDDDGTRGYISKRDVQAGNIPQPAANPAAKLNLTYEMLQGNWASNRGTEENNVQVKFSFEKNRIIKAVYYKGELDRYYTGTYEIVNSADGPQLIAYTSHTYYENFEIDMYGFRQGNDTPVHEQRPQPITGFEAGKQFSIGIDTFVKTDEPLESADLAPGVAM